MADRPTNVNSASRLPAATAHASKDHHSKQAQAP